jgi:predicted GH43/DUF377 family glycosyl hydrolase
MVTVKKEGVLLEKTNLGFEKEGVLNPAAIRVGKFVYILYRAVSKGNYSSIGFCKLDGPLELDERSDAPLIFPQNENESHGVEDPRISFIEDQYYITYTSYNGVNALGSLATSTDLIHFERKGIIVPKMTFEEFRHLAECRGCINEKYTRFNEKGQVYQKNGIQPLMWDKNVIFFPRKINNKLVFLHRIRPDIQIVEITNLEELTTEFWQHYFLHLNENIVLKSRYEHEVSYIGGGCPPIETEVGWLLIYHGVCDTPKGYVYSACAALLDIENPRKEIARLPYPLFKPEFSWELKGKINNVCFPTGAVIFDETLYIYYGAADERIATASIKIADLLTELLLNKK